MAPRPEGQGPPDIFYEESEARKYTSCSRIIEIQSKISERALELLALPNDGIPRLLLDIGCGSGLSGTTLSEKNHQWIGLDISPAMLDVAIEREVKGDLLLGDMGQGLGLRPGVVDGVISISAVQWLCNSYKSSHKPEQRLKAFFGSLYRCLARGARTVLQVYPENKKELELIVRSAMLAGFGGWALVDSPCSNNKKAYLVLTCGPPSLSSAALPKAIEHQVCVFDSKRPRKKQKVNKTGRGRILEKKEQLRNKGKVVPPDTKYTGRKRKTWF